MDTIELIRPMAKPCSKRSAYKALVPFKMPELSGAVLNTVDINKSREPLIKP